MMNLPPVSENRTPNIFPTRFWIDYKPQKDGSLKPVEMVNWQRRGGQNAATDSRIEHMQRNGGTPEWEVLKPYYEHWKKGLEPPVNGFPLERWPHAVNGPELVAALKRYEIRTVEDLANLEESGLTKVQFPGIRRLQQDARAFLQERERQAPLAAELDTLKQENETLRRELDELKQLIMAQPVKRGPGRPRKDTNVTVDNSSVSL